MRVRILSVSSFPYLRVELAKIGVVDPDLQAIDDSGQHLLVKVEGLEAGLTLSLKKEVSALGGEVFTSVEAGGAVFMGTQAQMSFLIDRLASGPHQAFAQELDSILERYFRPRPPLAVGGKTFHWGERTYIMGILNLTPDSFSGDGLAGHIEMAVERGERMAEEGADIIDIGGESTRPGSFPISAEEEQARVLPVIERLVGRINCPVSIDTYKSQVAEKALAAGASIVNDVWGLRMDPALAEIAAMKQAPLILMHNRSRPKDEVQSERLGGRYLGVEYKDLMGEIIGELAESSGWARAAGVEDSRIIVDPGIGFGKTVEQNLELMRRLPELRVLGYPLLVGPSRKSFIGYTLDLPVEERLEGTAAAVALAIAGGADIVRVHDVKQMARVAKMSDALVRQPIAKEELAEGKT